MSGKLKLIFDFISRYKKIKHDLTLVYTMGKVGSSSIYHSIHDNVGQIHSLDEEIPTKYFISKDRSTWIGHLISRIIWKLVVKKVKKCMDKSDKVKIITGVRDPVSRNVSSYFQGMQTKDKVNYDIENYLNEFQLVTNHNVPLYWFDHELKRHLGINIFETEFNKDLGYKIINKGKYEIFIYRLENLDSIIEEVRSFVGENNFSYTKKNITEKKVKNHLLSEFKNKVIFSNEYLEAMYNSKYMNHFYSRKEIKDFIKKYQQSNDI
jgi:hypothetical protein